jgi:hypothetical protein
MTKAFSVALSAKSGALAESTCVVLKMMAYMSVNENFVRVV